MREVVRDEARGVGAGAHAAVERVAVGNGKSPPAVIDVAVAVSENWRTPAGTPGLAAISWRDSAVPRLPPTLVSKFTVTDAAGA